MTLITIAIAAATLFLLAIVVSWILGWANIKFKVEVDPKIEEVTEVLPGVNCGGCGYLGCSDYAVAIVNDGVPITSCSVGGPACAADIAAIMGVEAGEMAASYAVVHCGSGLKERLQLTDYRGEKNCLAVSQVAGVQGCAYGCLGYGDCVNACKYDAIHVVDGLATVDYNKCIGCGACVRICPRGIIAVVPFHEAVIPKVACSNKDAGKDSRAVCKKSCIACKACTKLSEIFTIDGSLSKADYNSYEASKYDDVLKAVEKCPTKCIEFAGNGNP